MRVLAGLTLICTSLSGGAARAAAPDGETLLARISTAIEPAVRVLDERPYLLPPLSGTESLMRVDVRFDHAGVHIVQGSDEGGSLEGLARSLDGRRTEPPDYWVFALAPAATQVLYWTPVDDPRTGLVETLEDDRIEAHPLRMKTGVASVRVPFIPGGRIAVMASASDSALDIATIASELHPRLRACECPPSTLVMGNQSDPQRINVVFVPDGFTQTDLGLFPCAVQALLDAILKDKLLQEAACAFNFWRLDVESPTSGIDTALCSGGCPAITIQAGDVPPCERPTKTLKIFPPLCQPAQQSFHTKHCQNDTCEHVWPDAEDRQAARDLANACIPDGADFVMIVANSTTYGGGGFPAESTAVTTLWGLKDGSIENLAVHELGHALGLLDEYVGGIKDPFWAADRNIFECADIVGGSGCVTPAWHWHCSKPRPSPCTPKDFMGCQVVPSACSGAPSPKVGLYEGAFYQSNDYYRASSSCRMESMSGEFCVACRRWVFQVLTDEQNYCWLRQPDIPRTFPVHGNIWMPDVCEATQSRRGALHALVERGGLVGEVPVRSLHAEVTRERGNSGSTRLALNRRHGVEGDNWSWTLGKLHCGDLRGLRPRDTRLIDDVGGMEWTLRELRWVGEREPPR